MEKCCCEGDNCNHGDTTMEYMLAGTNLLCAYSGKRYFAGMPLFEPTRCNAVWRPPFWEDGNLVGMVYSKDLTNMGYDNGTTIRIKCPPDSDGKRWKAAFDPAAVCVDGKWLPASGAVNCDWSYKT